MSLLIAKNLRLPLELGSQAIAVLGIRGSGKTSTSCVIAEQLLHAGQQVVIIDPVGAWFGMRSSASGKDAGFPVFIFGGSHGDLPLAAHDGKTIAEFIVKERVPVILSLRHFRKGEARQFVVELFEELYHLKGKPEYRSPLTVFIDEASLFIPQATAGDVLRSIGAVEDLVVRGRNVGFGSGIFDLSQAVIKLKQPAKAVPNTRAIVEKAYEPDLFKSPLVKGACTVVEINSSALSKMERKLLTALAQHPNGLSKAQILLHANYAASGPISSAFARFSNNGWMMEHSGLYGKFVITQNGLATLGKFSPLPTGQELRELILKEAPGMESKLLAVIFEAYPNSISKGDVLRNANYAASGPISSAFAKFTRIGWIVKSGKEIKAADELYL